MSTTDPHTMIDEAAVAAFEAAFGGLIVRPTDSSYDTDRRIGTARSTVGQL